MILGNRKLILQEVAFLFMILIANNLLGQSQLLEKNESGFVFNAGFTSADNASGFLFSSGYSFYRVIDVGLTFERLAADDKLIANDLRANSINPYIRANIIKQRNNFPLSISFGIYIQNMQYSGDILDKMNWDPSVTGFSMGFSTYHSFEVSHSVDLIPEISLLHGTRKVIIKDKRNQENIILVDDYENTIVKFALNVSFKITSGQKIYFAPEIITTDDDNTIFNFLIGFVLPN